MSPFKIGGRGRCGGGGQSRGLPRGCRALARRGGGCPEAGVAGALLAVGVVVAGVVVAGVVVGDWYSVVVVEVGVVPDAVVVVIDVEIAHASTREPVLVELVVVVV